MLVLAAALALILLKGQLSSFAASDSPALPTPTELAAATLAPFQLNLPPLATPTWPAAPPTVTPPAPPASFALGVERYQHPGGLFAIAYDAPAQEAAAWQLVEEGESGSVFVDGGGLITFTVQMAHTAYTLEHEALLQFVDAWEQRAGPANTTAVRSSRVEDAARQSITVTTFDAQQPRPRVYIHAYQQLGSLIAIRGLVLDQESYLAYPNWAETLFASVILYPEQAAGLAAYAQGFEAADPSGQIRIDAPQGWKGDMLSGGYTWVATYHAPDSHAIIQLLTYNDGTAIEDEVADDFALFLLNTYLGTEIMVTAYHGLPDGSEQLEWRSPRYDFTHAGVSTYGRVGDTFYLLTLMYDVEYADEYSPVLARVQESLSILAAAPALEESEK